ncbi:unnamed protein product [Lota lota]
MQQMLVVHCAAAGRDEAVGWSSALSTMAMEVKQLKFILDLNSRPPTTDNPTQQCQKPSGRPSSAVSLWVILRGPPESPRVGPQHGLLSADPNDPPAALTGRQDRRCSEAPLSRRQEE